MIHSTEEAIQRIESILELQNKLAYDHFTTPQQLPFACYTYDFDTDGADDYKGAKATVWKLMFFSICTCLVMGTLLILLSPYIPRLYSGVTQDVRSMASSMLVLSACAMPLHAFAHCSYFTLRSGGKTVITFLFDCGYTWVISVPVAFLMVTVVGAPILWTYGTVQLADIIKCVFGFVLLRKGVWIQNIAKAHA